MADQVVLWVEVVMPEDIAEFIAARSPGTEMTPSISSSHAPADLALSRSKPRGAESASQNR